MDPLFCSRLRSVSVRSRKLEAARAFGPTGREYRCYRDHEEEVVFFLRRASATSAMANATTTLMLISALLV